MPQEHGQGPVPAENKDTDNNYAKVALTTDLHFMFSDIYKSQILTKDSQYEDILWMHGWEQDTVMTFI